MGRQRVADGERQRLGGEDRLACLLAAGPELLVAEAQARAALVDDAALDRAVEELAGMVDTPTPADLELGLLEGRGDLVLDDLDARLGTDRLFSGGHLARAADV